MGRFRSLVYIESGKCRLLSRNGNEFKSFAALKESLASEVSAKSAVIDGEIVCLDGDGKPQFPDLLFRRGEARFVAFDLLYVNGEDLRCQPLIERKLQLRSVVPGSRERLLYCDHIEHDGDGLFRLACEHDLEGIVAKRKCDPYLPGQASWLKIRNRAYSQWIGREEFFERERGADPDLHFWDSCALACEKETAS